MVRRFVVKSTGVTKIRCKRLHWKIFFANTRFFDCYIVVDKTFGGSRPIVDLLWKVPWCVNVCISVRARTRIFNEHSECGEKSIVRNKRHFFFSKNFSDPIFVWLLYPKRWFPSVRSSLSMLPLSEWIVNPKAHRTPCVILSSWRARTRRSCRRTANSKKIINQ